MNRSPGTLWPLTGNRKDPTAKGWVETSEEDDQLELVLPLFPGRKVGIIVTIRRRDARMLAQRINQCLDATTKNKRRKS